MKTMFAFLSFAQTARHRLWFVERLVLATWLLAFAGCGKTQTQTPAQPELPAARVSVQIVASKKSPVIEEVVGTVRARLHATLEAKISGRIVELPVVLGQAIKRGQLLVRLDVPEVKARLDQAEANFLQAEREWTRVAALFKQQAATQSDYDAADSHFRIAKGALGEAQAMMANVEIVAPFDGVVTRKTADQGDLAQPGKPLLDIEDPTRLQLEADVPEAIATNVVQNARMAIRLSDKDAELSGTVAEIAPMADPTSRTFRVKLDLPGGTSVLSGQFARLLVPVGESSILRVPTSAVVQRGQMEIVFAVENQRARLHLVKTGRHIGDEVCVLSGLDQGDSVVTDGAALLTDGQPVEAR
jgi:RND family efflux transporter MFP subunit